MTPSIAVAHYPEGAGHATRMLAIADELEAAGAEVRMAGGGAGSEFVSLNGYDAFEPALVDYIDTYQGGSMRDVLTGSVPASARRVRDYLDWFREINPDAVVTDDMFAAMAASRIDAPLYVVKHDVPDLYDDRVERSGAKFHTVFQGSVAREFFYPAVWPPSETDPGGASRVPPIALEGEADPEDAPDVLLVPSHYSSFEQVAAHLERQGHDVVNVGSDDWEAVPSLLPYIRAADVVVCSGYSTVMDAAVAGTPCVVQPETDEQVAVAERLEQDGVTGFTVVEDRLDVLDAVESPPNPPEFENGASDVAESVVSDLVDEAEETSPSQSDRADRPDPSSLTLLGDAGRAARLSVASVGIAGLVAQLVLLTGAYTAIERSLPTYQGSVSGLFVVGALLLVSLGTVGAVVDGGLLPSTILASGPVVGWATTHFLIGPAPRYAPSYPLEMALLYGGLFGTIGYLLGVRVRDSGERRTPEPSVASPRSRG